MDSGVAPQTTGCFLKLRAFGILCVAENLATGHFQVTITQLLLWSTEKGVFPSASAETALKEIRIDQA
jgi:hypothetical protein